MKKYNVKLMNNKKGFIKQGEIQSAMFDGTIMAYKQAMIKKASE